MRALLSTIGSRGDVQPLVALASQLQALGQEVRLCVPPDFRAWIEGLGFQVVSIGPELRKFTAPGPAMAPLVPTPKQQRQMVEATVATQFETIEKAAQDCDIIVGATALQIAAPSVAEKMGIPYVFTAYCPAVLPSLSHAPPPFSMLGQKPAPATADYQVLWERNAERFNDTWGALLNSHRSAMGLKPVTDVYRYILTDRPWLAADTLLSPWPDPSDPSVLQTGAWLMPDERPLPVELEEFLAAGEQVIFFGFGSMRAAWAPIQVMIDTARALGYRAIVSRGWNDVLSNHLESDCLIIDDVNLLKLFKRVAAVVHHGGAGTTTTAALAGAPQVVIPQVYDQHYFAKRVEELGLGSAHAPGAPTRESLKSTLERSLEPGVAIRAQHLATAMRKDGAQNAATHLRSFGECLLA